MYSHRKKANADVYLLHFHILLSMCYINVVAVCHLELDDSYALHVFLITQNKMQFITTTKYKILLVVIITRNTIYSMFYNQEFRASIVREK